MTISATKRWVIPQYPSRIADPTGGRDAFAGGFLVGYREDYDPLAAFPQRGDICLINGGRQRCLLCAGCDAWLAGRATRIPEGPRPRDLVFFPVGNLESFLEQFLHYAGIGFAAHLPHDLTKEPLPQRHFSFMISLDFVGMFRQNLTHHFGDGLPI